MKGKKIRRMVGIRKGGVAVIYVHTRTAQWRA